MCVFLLCIAFSTNHLPVGSRDRRLVVQDAKSAAVSLQGQRANREVRTRNTHRQSEAHGSAL